LEVVPAKKKILTQNFYFFSLEFRENWQQQKMGKDIKAGKSFMDY
jgi:hypothetical protein